MERADVRRPVAEERDRDARLAAQLEGERRAGDRRQPAADDRVRAQVPALDVVEVHRAAVPVRAALDLPVQLRHQLVRVRPAGERVRVRAVRGREDVAVLHRLADADRDRLLADRDMQEAGQLAGAEALLDLLLDVPDQEHLAEELAQAFLREPGPLALDLRHEPEFMLRAMTLARQWIEIKQELPADWTHAAPDADDLRRSRGRDRGGVPRPARAGALGPRLPHPRPPRLERDDDARARPGAQRARRRASQRQRSSWSGPNMPRQPGSSRT